MLISRLWKGLKLFPFTSARFVDFCFSYNQPVTLIRPGSDEAYTSTVYDYESEANRLVIFVPRAKESAGAPRLAPGDSVTLTVAQGGAACEAEARVVEIRSWPQEVLVLDVPERWRKKQDRQFYRLAVDLPLRYAPVTGRGLNPEDFRSSRTLDLSGGGAKFPVDGRHRRGDQLYVQFDVVLQGEIHPLVLTGRIVRIENSLGLGPVVAVQFIDISEREQRLLVDYVAGCQFGR